MYGTLKAFVDQVGYAEIAATSGYLDQAEVSPELFRATVDSASRTQWTAEETASADAIVLRVTEALDQAAEVIDGTLRTLGFDVPVSAPDDLILKLQRQLARYDLHQERPGELIRQHYEDALAMLEKIVKSEIRLDPTIDGSSSTGDPAEQIAWAIGPPSSNDTRVYTDDKLSGYTRR